MRATARPNTPPALRIAETVRSKPNALALATASPIATGIRIIWIGHKPPGKRLATGSATAAANESNISLPKPKNKWDYGGRGGVDERKCWSNAC